MCSSLGDVAGYEMSAKQDKGPEAARDGFKMLPTTTVENSSTQQEALLGRGRAPVRTPRQQLKRK
jgi:hypothetical protein